MTRNPYRNMLTLAVGVTLAVISLGVNANSAHGGTDHTPIDRVTHSTLGCTEVDYATLRVEYRDCSKHATPKWMNRVCIYEDSRNCFYDAKIHGNDRGQSFFVRRFPGRGHLVCVMYLNHNYAMRHDHCMKPR